MTVATAKEKKFFVPNVECPKRLRSKYYEATRDRMIVICGASTLQTTDLLDTAKSDDQNDDLVILVKAPFRERALGMFGKKRDFDMFIQTMRKCHWMMQHYKGTIFVCCQSGRTRSAAILIGHLVLENKWSLLTAKRQVNACMEHRGDDEWRADRRNVFTVGIQALRLGVFDFSQAQALRLGEDDGTQPLPPDVDPRWRDAMEQGDTQPDDFGFGFDDNVEASRLQDVRQVPREKGMRHKLLKLAAPETFSDDINPRGTCTSVAYN